MRNYLGRGLCYVPKPKVEADNTNRGINNFTYPIRTEFNNCFNIYLYLYQTQGKQLHCKQDLSFKEAVCFLRFWYKLQKLM